MINHAFSSEESLSDVINAHISPFSVFIPNKPVCIMMDSNPLAVAYSQHDLSVDDILQICACNFVD